MADIVVYTLGWKVDEAIKPGEKPGAQIRNRVVIDGHEIPSIHHLTVETDAVEFAEATARIQVATIRYVPLGHDEFYAESLPAHPPKVATVHVSLEQAAPEFVRAALELAEQVEQLVMGRGSYLPVREAAGRLREIARKGSDTEQGR